MSLSSRRFRYYRWDGTQQIDQLDAEQILDAIADDVLADGDLTRALQRLFRWGSDRPDSPFPGMRDLLERIRERRQQELSRYNLGSVLDDLNQRLDDVIDTERQGIERRLSESRERLARQQARQRGEPPFEASGQASEIASEAEEEPYDESLHELLERMAARKQSQLDALPPDPAGRIKSLMDYEFMDPTARQKFQELLASLQQQMLQQTFQGMQQAIQSMTPEDLANLRNMLHDLNEMLEERQRGGQPDFERFMHKYGHYFGQDLKNLDELLDYLARQMAAMQSLLDSMTPEMRQQLQDALDAALQDPGIREELAQLAYNLGQLMPDNPYAQSYQFSGGEELTLSQAMRLMEHLREMQELEEQLEGVRDWRDLQRVDMDKVRELFGDQLAAEMDQLRQLTRLLEDAGYIQRTRRGYELTPRGVRKIGQKALREIFQHLKKDRFGQHQIDRTGRGGEPSDDSKPYEFGDPFLLHLPKTVMNAVYREGPGSPVRLQPDDFEVYRSELMTQSSTVLMVDMSRSMLYNGCFLAAKKVALALDSLIRSQFPRDNLYIVGFSYVATELKPSMLPHISWDEYNYGTNMQHGFMLARQLLSRHRGGNKQIIVITDGEPTAYFDGEQVRFSYPPTYQTFQETLKEVARCTREQIVINTFMLERSPYMAGFVSEMARINKGRAFFATPDHLGEYVLLDYVANKRTRLR
ncbi:VWA domain-containing protein [Thermomicrobiaceae bacterium CFH 74404]|uniref:VWA domain-containing protein n=1 Tax=Thermalbibacter longus TaxID=2951981 RepID=A0AA41WIC3_9BACT|nr:VWA domain-containing protein [Thermalbibacter longus]MCM8749886.1 VWA domain-containing protein [Thermalbibacter longus]